MRLSDPKVLVAVSEARGGWPSPATAASVREDAGMGPEVPLDGWQVGPWNRWAYLHAGEIVATVPVPCGDGPTWALGTVAADLDDLVVPLLETAYVDGLAVVHDSALVLERYPGAMGSETLHLSQSVGKSVLGLLVGILAQQGRLDPGELVTERVSEVADSGYADATVEHLLDMTAAIDFVEDYAGDFWRYDVACGWHPPVPGADAGAILEFLPTIGPADCLFTRAGFRKRGVSRALARAAVDFARERGARAIEGYPITTKNAIAEELHVGTEGVFAAAGFTEVSRPTLRRVVMRIEV